MKLSIKILATISLFFILIAIALTAGISRMVARTVQETVVNDMSRQVKAFGELVVNQKLLDRPGKMEEQLIKLQQQQHYLKTAYILINGEIAFSTDPEQLHQNIFTIKYFREHLPKRILLEQKERMVRQGDQLIFHYPIKKEGQISLLGHFSIVTITTFTTQLRTNLMVYLGVVLALFLILLYVILYFLILKPIGKLEEKTRAVSEGNFDYETEPPGNDELGMVNKIFDQMAHNIGEMLTEKDTLLRILSHDLTNQIGSSKNLLTEVVGQLNNLDDEMTGRYLNGVCQALDQSFELISFTRELIAIETGKLKLETRSVQIEPLIRTILPGFIQQGKGKDLAIRFSPKENELEGVIEPVIFKHTIMGNLLSNAIKFSYPSGEIRISMRAGHNCCIISVQNRGPYISPSKLKTIFRLTHKTSTPGTTGEQGSGLGLPLVHKFITLLGGKIQATSIPIVAVESGRETPADNEFVVMLPLGGDGRCDESGEVEPSGNK